MAVKITDTDKGWSRIKLNVAAVGKGSVKVGVMDGGETINGTTVLDYAMYNEFGTRHIPARPFMSTTAEEHRDGVAKFAEYLAGQLIDGKITVPKLLAVLGADYQSKVQMTIRNAVSWAAPLNEATIKAKGSSSPLIDTGRMIGSIRYEVET